MPALNFTIHHRASDCLARAGRVTTPHGSFDTPAFMPVGTQATVKGLFPHLVADLGSQIILANTYHLMLRPGSELIARMGGLHAWMKWPHSILTDSGGFQVFSLSDINRVTDQGVEFKSHLDGSLVTLTPARSIQVQNQLGADIIMAFDECPPPRKVQSPRSKVQGQEEDVQCHDDSGDATCGLASSTLDLGPWTLDSSSLRSSVERSARWLEQSVQAHARKNDQALFGIVQGGTDLDLRSWSVAQTASHDLPGYAIGGVAVGEGFEGLKAVVEHTAPLLPEDRPRYLMGVGYERDILTAVRAGVDMFDCVLPTRNGRNANAFTPTGQIRLRNARFEADSAVIDPACDCPACLRGEGFSRSYLRHLFQAGEMLGPILVSAHNIRHFQRYLLDIRNAIVENNWSLIAGRWPVLSQPPKKGLSDL